MMIDTSMALVLVGAAIQALPPVRSLVIHVRRRTDVRQAQSSRRSSIAGQPARI